MNCPFCDAEPNPDKWNGETISYMCGTIVGDQMPRTSTCWHDTWMRQKETISKLECIIQKAESPIGWEAVGSYYSVEEMGLIGCVSCGKVFDSNLCKERRDEQIHKEDCPTKIAREIQKDPIFKAVIMKGKLKC